MQQQPLSPSLPPVTPLVRNLLVGLFALYATELFCRNGLGLPVDVLRWMPFGAGFAPWQPLSRYLVQGQNFFGVVMTGLVVYLILPPLQGSFTRTQILQALGLSALGGTAFVLLGALVGLWNGQTTGIGPLVVVLFTLFGLNRPEAIIRLFFVLAVPAKTVAWGAGVIAFLGLLATFDMGWADSFGTWAASIGWWFWLGPGSRRRRLKRKSRHIESQLRVLQGGRNGPIH